MGLGYSTISYFKNIKSFHLERTKLTESGKMLLQKDLDFTGDMKIILDDAKKLLHELNEDDTVELKVKHTDGRDVGISNRKGITELIEIFEYLTTLQETSNPHKNNVKIYFKASNIEFFESKLDVEGVKKLCEKLSKQFLLDIEPIPVYKDGYMVMDKGMSFKNAYASTVLKN